MDYRIVVVDDETLSLTNAKGMLEEENMRVSCLRSGRMLLKFIEKNTPDLILLDILMPEMDGFETYTALRKREEELGKSRTPVIFLTGENNSDMERRGLKAGASDFIHKPFNKDILIRRIHNTITNSKTIESLTEEATIDKLTGFLNKASGTAKVSKLCDENSGTMVIMDIDNFKLVNDLFGHDMGDHMLQAFAEIVRHNTRETDVISRIGGDEFMAFFIGMSGEHDVASLAMRLNRQLAEEAAARMGENHGIPLGISLGAVLVPEHGRNYESLFTLADNSLYYVKQNGKHGYNLYGHLEPEKCQDGCDLEKEVERITRIVEERSDRNGALLLGRESFSIVYRFLMRFYKRYGGSSVRIIFEVDPENENDSQSLMECSVQFGELLQKSLRKSDLVMQSKSSQFFICLNERNEFEAEVVIHRIIELWNELNHSEKVKIRYSYKYSEFSKEEKNDKNETAQ